jgi:regulator of protease activity HflC (stomatin/prohibitin superfamily)
MFGEIFGFIRDLAQLAWPFRVVNQWERAGYFVCGRWWKEVGPGLKVVVPWFIEVRPMSIAEAIVGTGRQDITLTDGSMLSFAATATMRVVDVNRAINAVNDVHSTAQELLASVLADRLAGYSAEQLEEGSRRRLLGTLVKAVDTEAEAYGMTVTKVRFTSFVLNLRTYRLLMDQNTIAAW